MEEAGEFNQFLLFELNSKIQHMGKQTREDEKKKPHCIMHQHEGTYGPQSLQPPPASTE